MQIKMPHFKYRSHDSANKHVGCIEMDGQIIHVIENPEEFHRTFGYSRDIAKAGVLPDEFMWERFSKDAEAKCGTCFQLHIFQYLMRHSDTFRKKYEDQKEDWVLAYAMAGIVCKKIECLVCKTLPVTISDGSP